MTAHEILSFLAGFSASFLWAFFAYRQGMRRVINRVCLFRHRDSAEKGRALMKAMREAGM